LRCVACSCRRTNAHSRPLPTTTRHRPAWLALDGLGDLKHRTGAVIIMIMVVNIFEHAKKMPVTDPVHLVYLSGAALLSAMAISLMGVEFNKHEEEEEEKEKHAPGKK
jgi:uncharacterized membrane protein YqhA